MTPRWWHSDDDDTPFAVLNSVAFLSWAADMTKRRRDKAENNGNVVLWVPVSQSECGLAQQSHLSPYALNEMFRWLAIHAWLLEAFVNFEDWSTIRAVILWVALLVRELVPSIKLCNRNPKNDLSPKNGTWRIFFHLNKKTGKSGQTLSDLSAGKWDMKCEMGWERMNLFYWYFSPTK